MKKLLMSLASLCVGMTLTAAPVTKDAARQKALQFLTERGSGIAAARGTGQTAVQLKETVATDQLYVFNIGQQEGFVIVSGDDCTGDLVLGYADSGEITADNMPDNMRTWFEEYARQIKWMQQHHTGIAASRAARTSTVRKSVSPLLTCQWDQNAPFNDNCPKMTENGKETAATGCVATAAAQIMYYQAMKHGITETTTKKETKAYNNTTFYYWYINGTPSTNMPSKPVTVINWSEMKDRYPSDNATANAAVAKLIEYVGAGVEMQYGMTSTASTSNVPNMLVDLFDYDADVRIALRNDYTYSEWFNLIYKELSTNGPVLFSAQSMGGGHAFVIDGYSEEDFFHINWGWGGTSNGYYRLSALNPTSQGIGGSTTDDGYNFDQDIIINVCPIDDGITATGEELVTITRCDCPETSFIKYDNSNFGQMKDNVLTTGVRIDYSFSNKTGKTQGFDYGFALYQGDSMIQLLSNATEEDLSNSYSGFLYVQFGLGLASGEYRIINVSRKKGSDRWLPSIDSEQFYIKATVDGNNMTLENIAEDRTPHLSAILVQKGSAMTNKPLTMTAKISNIGYQYNGTIQLIQKSDSKNYLLAARQIDVEHGASQKEFDFTFTPTTTGNWELVLWDKDNKLITTQSTTVNVNAGPVSTIGVLKVESTDLKNGDLSSGQIYGTTARATIMISNSATADHTSSIKVALMHWTPQGEGHFTGESTDIKSYDLNIAAGQTATLDIELDGMHTGEKYSFLYYDIAGHEFSRSSFFDAYEGVDFYTADGQVKSIKKESEIVTPDDASAYVGDNVTSLIPNNNSNALYFVGTTIPAGLEGRNVISNGLAESLNISDEQPFYTPQTFTATRATYTRRVTQGGDGTTGWTTIIIPFDVKEIKVGDRTIDWFHSSSDSGKQFWLKTFSSDDSNGVTFDYTDRIEANTPYIICVPNDKWGEEWDLTNKDITFVGEDVMLQANAVANLNGDYFRFVSQTVTSDVTNLYAINAVGDAFELTTSATVAPFRAYFKSVGNNSATRLPISPETTVPTAIAEVKTTLTDNTIHTLDGRQVTTMQRGIYIVNGKKIIK